MRTSRKASPAILRLQDNCAPEYILHVGIIQVFDLHGETRRVNLNLLPLARHSIGADHALSGRRNPDQCLLLI